MQADAGQVGGVCDGRPRPFQVGTRSTPLTRDDVRVAFYSRQVSYDGLRRTAEEQRFSPRLAVGQEDDAALNIDLAPPSVKNLAQPRARQEQQADGSDGERIEASQPLLRLRSVLGLRPALIDRIGQPCRLGEPQRVS